MARQVIAFLLFFFFLAAFAAPSQAAQFDGGWKECAAMAEPNARLACYDRWSAAQSPTPPVAPTATIKPTAPIAPIASVAVAPAKDRCHAGVGTPVSRFWELEKDTSCDVFGIRGYRPISLSLISSDSVNDQPASGNPLNNAPGVTPYRKTETRLQLSVRTKLAQGLLSQGDARDSIWFAYTQQSYWQLFTPWLSRPFRDTDHEPEFIYVYPLSLKPFAGWSLRYACEGIVHQSK